MVLISRMCYYRKTYSAFKQINIDYRYKHSESIYKRIMYITYNKRSETSTYCSLEVTYDGKVDSKLALNR